MQFQFCLFSIVVICATSSTARTIFQNFASPSPGTYALFSLIQTEDGAFYGAAHWGGNVDARYNEEGTIFKVAPDGTTSTFFLTNTTGTSPNGPLVHALDGNFYGTTSFGGANSAGTVFRITPQGNISAIFSFDAAINGSPQQGAGLIQGPDGFLYGATAVGVYRITTSGDFSIIGNFNYPSGTGPIGPVLFGRDGTLYGTYPYGPNGKGFIFNVTTNGGLHILHLFGGPDGSIPSGPLAQDNAGNLYGTTTYGGGDPTTNYTGNVGYGTVFRLSPSGTFETLASFYRTNGAFPYSAPVLASDGNFYGTTSGGGPLNAGTIYCMDSNGNLTTLYEFSDTDGSGIYAGLIQAQDGRFYGESIAPNGGYVYRISVPMVPSIQSISPSSSGGISLAWRAVAGQTYQVQYATRLDNPNWTNLGGTVTANNRTATAVDSTVTTSRFYRVVLPQ